MIVLFIPIELCLYNILLTPHCWKILTNMTPPLNPTRGQHFSRRQPIFLRGRLIFLRQKEMTNFGLFQEGCVAGLPQPAWSLSLNHMSAMPQHITIPHTTFNTMKCNTIPHNTSSTICANVVALHMVQHFIGSIGCS